MDKIDMLAEKIADYSMKIFANKISGMSLSREQLSIASETMKNTSGHCISEFISKKTDDLKEFYLMCDKIAEAGYLAVSKWEKFR